MSTRRYDLLLLDFDGTLVDSFPLFEQVMDQVIVEFGLRPLDRVQLHGLRALDTPAMFKALGVRWWRVPALTRRVRALVAPHAAGLCLFDGIAHVLPRLHAQGVQLAVVTSNNRATVQAVLGDVLLQCMAQLHCGVPLLGKRRVLARAVRASGVAPGRVLSIGDECRDARASQALGIDFCGVSWGFSLPEVLQAHSRFALLEHPHELWERVMDSTPAA
jgi:phosphoglycolate phosphatase